jgi:hypothetical protein
MLKFLAVVFIRGDNFTGTDFVCIFERLDLFPYWLQQRFGELDLLLAGGGLSAVASGLFILGFVLEGEI